MFHTSIQFSSSDTLAYIQRLPRPLHYPSVEGGDRRPQCYPEDCLLSAFVFCQRAEQGAGILERREPKEVLKPTNLLRSFDKVRIRKVCLIRD